MRDVRLPTTKPVRSFASWATGKILGEDKRYKDGTDAITSLSERFSALAEGNKELREQVKEISEPHE
jgi:hypothetical protein